MAYLSQRDSVPACSVSAWCLKPYVGFYPLTAKAVSIPLSHAAFRIVVWANSSNPFALLEADPYGSWDRLSVGKIQLSAIHLSAISAISRHG